MSEIKLNLLNRLHLIWEIITTRSGHKHSSSSKQLSTFQQGYSAGVEDERYNTKELKRQLEEARKALEVVYDPICDMTFVIENEIKNMGVLTPVAKSMLIDASCKIMQGAKESEWFKKQLKEKGDE